MMAKRASSTDAVGVSRRFVIGKWVTARNEVGDVALDGGNRGRRPGEQMVLAEKDAARIPPPHHRQVPDR